MKARRPRRALVASVVGAGVLLASLLAGVAGAAATAAPAGGCSSPAASAAWAWGSNASGQLGDGSTADRATPQQVAGLGSGAGVTVVAAGGGHSLAVASGRLWAWGNNSSGQLGDGTTQTRLTPVLVAFPPGTGTPTAVAAGPNFSLAVIDGSVWAWGDDSLGQLGFVGQTSHIFATPVQVGGLPAGVTAVAAGDGFSLALAAGAVWSWGRNDAGQLGFGQVGGPNNNGTTPPVPYRASPAAVTGLSQVTVAAISSQKRFSLAVAGDGTVWGWGDNGDSELGGNATSGANPTPVQVGGLPPGVTAVAAGSRFSLALAGGVVWGWGFGHFLGDPSLNHPVATPMQVPNVSAVSIAAGDQYGAAVRTDGQVVEWGLPPAQANPAFVGPTVVPGLDQVAGLAAGGQHTLAIRRAAEPFLSPCAGSTPQSTTVGAAFGSPLAVQVKDKTGAPVGGVAVTFSVQPSAGGASASLGTASGPVTAVSDAGGVAATPVRATGVAGTYSVAASASGYQAAVFTLSNLQPPAAMTVVSGDKQQTRVLTDFPSPLQVEVVDSAGNPVSAPVTFTVQPASGGAGATFPVRQTSVTVPSGLDGRAAAPALTANATPGSFTVTAGIAGTGVTASFSLTTFVPVPASVQLVSGDNQSAAIGSDRFPSNLSVRVLDNQSGPATGAAVTFVVVSSAAGAGATLNGAAAPATVTTLADGTASVSAAPNGVAGSYTVQASVPGVASPAVFHLSNTAPDKPVVTSVAPSAGPQWGGTEVAIQGSGFGGPLPVTTVFFGPVAVPVEPGGAGSVVRAVAPPGTVGASVPVTVARADPSLPASDPGPATFSWFAGGWQPAGTLAQARSGHSATVLGGASCQSACGEVLLAGGESGVAAPCAPSRSSGAPASPAALQSAEVYDPAGQVSDDVDHLHIGRVDHAATALADGRVLVVGGCSAGQALGSAEIFDPSVGWVPAGDLQVPRADATATLLGNGDVLVAGGIGADGQALSSAEVFDPAVNSPGRAVAGATITVGSAVLTSPAGGFTAADVGRVVTTDAASDGSRALPSGAVVAAIDGPSSITLSMPALASVGTATLTLGPLTGTWTTTAAMAVARLGHSATLLADGRVLVAGGADAAGLALSSYELYIPGKGTWTEPAGTLAAARWGHSATLIAGGKVLVAGGCCTTTAPVGALASAELYDPGANNGNGGWAPTAALASARQGHTATLVDDGTVLIAGGASGPTGEVIAGTERYDPARGTWSDRGPLLDARVRHSAVALPHGRVMVAGGTAPNGEVLASVDVFDPAGGQPGPIVAALDPATGAAGSVITIEGAGFYSAATTVTFGTVVAPGPTVVSDHRIVVTVPDQPRGTVQVTVTRSDNAGNRLPSPATPAAEFTYSAGGWTPAAALDSCTNPSCVPRTRHTATVLDAPACHQANPPPPWCGLVLVAGGATSGAGTPTNTAELYNPALGTWTPTGSMTDARMNHTATLLADGTVLVVGGEGADRHRIGTAEVYGPASGAWTKVGPLHDARFQHTATLLADGRVLIVGGTENELTQQPVATAEIYDSAAQQFTRTSQQPDSCAPDPACVPRTGHTATLLTDGTVLLVGGLTIQPGGAPPAPPLPSTTSSAELYDPGSGTWKPTDALPAGEQRAYHTATALNDGRVLVAGGFGGLDASDTPDFLASAWLYEPKAAAGSHWQAGPTMATGRAAFSATVLVGGTVLVVGGGAPLPPEAHLAGGGPRFSTPPLAAAEFFDPSAANDGTWVPTADLGTARGGHTATVLDAPGCHAPTSPPASPPPAWCGAVLVAGGTPTGNYSDSTGSAELYTPAPSVDAVTPSSGPPSGGTTVTIDGSGFTGATTVRFGSAPATIVSQTPTEIVVQSPPHGEGSVAVSVTAAGGSSLTAAPNPAAMFSYQATPGCPAAGQGQAHLGPGYSLVGLPAGTNVGADSPLYGWWDVGAGGSYQKLDAHAVPAGRGYFAWFRCARAVSLASTAPVDLQLSLGGYHASMVGNPSSGTVTVFGFDYAARWVPALNNGAGGYLLSQYRQAQTLAPGEGIWVFAYQPTTITIHS